MTDRLDSQAFDLLEGGNKLDLFQPVDVPSEREVINQFYKGHKPADPMSVDDVHEILQNAGLVGIEPADALDGIIYGFQGEFGDMAISWGNMIPYVGSYLAVQRKLKKAEDAGEKIIKVYRGYPQWFRESMVKEGKFISGAKRVDPKFSPKEDMKVKDIFYSSTDKKVAEGYATNPILDRSKRGGMKFELTDESRLLEFHIPESYFNTNAISRFGRKNLDEIDDYKVAVFEGGLPKEFLVKVHKYDAPARSYDPWKNLRKYPEDAIQ